MLEASRGIEVKLERVFRELQGSAKVALRREGFPEKEQRHERSLAVRYQGQSFELQLKQPRGDIAAAFHRAHRARYGYAQEKNVVEIVSARVRSTGIVNQMSLRRARGTITKTFAIPHDSTETYLQGKKVRTAIYDRARTKSGTRFRLPCIVTEYSATTLIPEGVNASVDSQGNIVVEMGKI
jgi:N-methylhydantoinase A